MDKSSQKLKLSPSNFTLHLPPTLRKWKSFSVKQDICVYTKFPPQWLQDQVQIIWSVIIRTYYNLLCTSIMFLQFHLCQLIFRIFAKTLIDKSGFRIKLIWDETKGIESIHKTLKQSTGSVGIVEDVFSQWEIYNQSLTCVYEKKANRNDKVLLYVFVVNVASVATLCVSKENLFLMPTHRLKISCDWKQIISIVCRMA